MQRGFIFTRVEASRGTSSPQMSTEAIVTYVTRATEGGGGPFLHPIFKIEGIYIFRRISGYLISLSDTSELENPFRSPISLSYSSEILGVFTFFADILAFSFKF